MVVVVGKGKGCGRWRQLSRQERRCCGVPLGCLYALRTTLYPSSWTSAYTSRGVCTSASVTGSHTSSTWNGDGGPREGRAHVLVVVAALFPVRC